MDYLDKSLRSHVAFLSLSILPFLNLMSFERIAGIDTANNNAHISQKQVEPKQLTDYFT